VSIDRTPAEVYRFAPRLPGVTDEQYAEDTRQVGLDLDTLKAVLERRV
jgi:hypothetical protein